MQMATVVFTNTMAGPPPPPPLPAAAATPIAVTPTFTG